MGRDDTSTLVSRRRAADLVGKTPRTIRSWVEKGRLLEFRDDNGCRFYRLDDVLKLRPQPVAVTS